MATTFETLNEKLAALDVPLDSREALEMVVEFLCGQIDNLNPKS